MKTAPESSLSHNCNHKWQYFIIVIGRNLSNYLADVAKFIKKNSAYLKKIGIASKSTNVFSICLYKSADTTISVTYWHCMVHAAKTMPTDKSEYERDIAITAPGTKQRSISIWMYYHSRRIILDSNQFHKPQLDSVSKCPPPYIGDGVPMLTNVL